MPIDYKIINLSKSQKLGFIALMTVLGLIFGILFFDSLKLSLLVTLLLMKTILPIYKSRLLEKRKQELLVQFRDMLYSISSSVSSGRTMAQAIFESISFWASTYDEEDYIMKELRYMSSMIENGNENDLVVLRDFAKRSGIEDVEDFVNVYEIAKSTGSNLPLAIDRATSIIGDKISLENELKTMMSEKMFETRIVAASPFLMVTAMRLMSPNYLLPMTTTPKGRVIMGVAFIVMLVAVVMIEKINRIKM